MNFFIHIPRAVSALGELFGSLNEVPYWPIALHAYFDWLRGMMSWPIAAFVVNTTLAAVACVVPSIYFGLRAVSKHVARDGS